MLGSQMPGQNDLSRNARIPKIHSKMLDKVKPSGRLSSSAPVVNGSRGKGSWRYSRKPETLGKNASPVPASNSSKAIHNSEAVNPPDLVEGNGINPINVFAEANDLGRKCPRQSNSNPETPGMTDRAAPDSNSFAALLSPEADTLHTLSKGSGNPEISHSVEPVPDSNLSEDLESGAFLFTVMAVMALLPAVTFIEDAVFHFRLTWLDWPLSLNIWSWPSCSLFTLDRSGFVDEPGASSVHFLSGMIFVICG
ncbi:hypothetical protein Nepgr_005383 [Nepenthes gracilis]|uniref:Uncharacterized protein n=1 Tax=Nepenthes gracilis TaxID=150966 RepID=A0AAD3S336_NEPGR|nr:hypothetical protein Nepgr_005383 [Nepenthes gracilis]